jgi:type VI secretion system secreted protein VgrG
MDPSLGAFGAQSGLQHLEVRQRMVAREFQVCDRSEQQPALAIAGAARVPGATPDSPRPTQVHFGTGALGPDQARSQAQLLAERAAVESFELTAQGDIAAFAAGCTFSLDAALLSPALSGDYLIIRLRHRASQKAGEGVAGEGLAYSNQASLIRRETPYRPAQPPRLQLPMTFTARIEAGGPCAQLDEQGRYRLRPHFDREEKTHGEASIPIRRLTPYGGPPGEQPTGLHLPLRDGAEVLLSCLNGDPDRPMIVGSVPNPQTASPVTSANPHQNRLRSAGDNELCLDDQIGAEAITLRTFAGHNILQLNAAALGHQIRLASEQGAMQWQAKKTLKVQSGDTLSERSGNDRIQTVENRHQTVTNQGEIHYQAATDLRQSAANNLRLEAGQNIEASSGTHLRIAVEEGKQLTVHGP